MPRGPKKAAVINAISKVFRVVGVLLAIYFLLISIAALGYYVGISLGTNSTSQPNGPVSTSLTESLHYGLMIELVLMFSFMALFALASWSFKSLGTGLVVSLGFSVPIVTLIVASYYANLPQDLGVAAAIFFLISVLVLPLLLRKRGGLKTALVIVPVSVLILLPLLTYSLIPLSQGNLPVVAFLYQPNKYLDTIGLLSSFGVVLGAALMSLRPGYRTGKAVVDVFLPSVTVTLAGAISYVVVWESTNYLLYLLVLLGFLSFLSVIRTELGLIPASVALMTSAFLAYQGVKLFLSFSQSTLNSLPDYLYSPIPLTLLYIVGVNSPKVFNPHTLERRALASIKQGRYGEASYYINSLRVSGVSETEVFLDVLSDGNCNAIVWMMSNFDLDYKVSGKLLRKAVDCVMKANAMPPSIDKVLDVLVMTDPEYAEKLAGYILSKGTKDVRAQKAKQVLGKLYGSRQPQQPTQQTATTQGQVKAPPLDQWRPELWLGRELYGYKVTKVLGVGGTSYVLEGTRGNDRYAIKVPKLSMAQKEATRASFTTFVDLSKESSRLQELSENSDAIVRIFGVFVDLNTIKGIQSGETYYYLTTPPAIVMEMMDGGTLNDLIKRREVILSRYWPEAVKLIFLRVAYALDFIHNPKISGNTTGYVHLDVKPQNIFFKSPPGYLGEMVLENLKLGRTTVKLGDLGSARRIGERFFEYTPDYCPIDQVEAAITGRGAHPSMDVYAFGATLYKALTGTTYNPPEMIKLMDEAVDRVLSGSKGAMDLLNQAKGIYLSIYGRNLGDVPERFRQVILATTNPDPAKRPSMRDVVEMLKRI